MAAEAWWIALQTGKFLHKGTIWEDHFEPPKRFFNDPTQDPL